MKVSALERRWIASICQAILPKQGETFLPGGETLPIEAFVDEFFAYTPGGSSIGVRLATWVIMFVSLVRYGTRFGKLDRARQADLLNAMSSSKWYAIRELPMLLKLVAFMAWDGDPKVHRSLGVLLHDGSSPEWLEKAKQ